MNDPQEIKSAGTPRKISTPVVLIVFLALTAFLIILGVSLKRAQSGPISIGQEVPAFELTSFEGDTVSTADLKGKVVVINFWASWCLPCADEAEALEAVYQKYKDNDQVFLIGVDYVDTEPQALEFIRRYQQTYFNAPDMQTKVSQMFRIKGVPETYFIDKTGKLAYAKIGPFASEAELITHIEKLLEQ